MSGRGRDGTARAGAGGLAVVLGTLAVTLVLGAAVRAPCAELNHAFRPELPYRLCYTDIVALYGDRALHDRFPYVDAANEYPVGTGLLMGVTAIPADEEGRYLLINEVLLGGAALVVALVLFRLVGRRALFFTAAPALVASSFLNWDLFAIAIAVVAVDVFLRRRDAASGALLGLGAATKLFPAFLVPAFALDREREGDRTGAIRLAVWAAAAWLLVNLPFIVKVPGRWSLFFRFNQERPVDPATLWGLGCSLERTGLCPGTKLVNVLSLLVFVAGAVAVLWLRERREPDFPRWTFGLALFVLFLLTNKVYSPQYSLWLVPWFALVLPDVRVFVVWSVADVTAWIVTLASVRQVPGFEGPPLGVVKLTVVLRAAALVWVLVSYVRRPSEAEPAMAERSAVKA